jgi:hypothetical protein
VAEPRAAQRRAAQAEAAQLHAAQAAATPRTPATRLALPAPVEIPVLPAINDLHALLAAARPLPVR